MGRYARLQLPCLRRSVVLLVAFVELYKDEEQEEVATWVTERIAV